MDVVDWKKAGTDNLKRSVKLMLFWTVLVRLVFSLLFFFFPRLLENARAVMAAFLWPSFWIPLAALYVSYRASAANQQKYYYNKGGKAPVKFVVPAIASLLACCVLWFAFTALLYDSFVLENAVATARLWKLAAGVCIAGDHLLLVFLAYELPPDKIGMNRL